MTDFHIFESHAGFVAASNRLGFHLARGLPRFGSYLIESAKRAGQDGTDIEFSFSASLARRFPLCVTCAGAGQVKAPGTVAGQYLANEFDSIDFGLVGTRTCGECKGSGVTVTDFFAPL